MVQPAPDGIRWPRHNAATLLAGVGGAPVAGGPGWHSGRRLHRAATSTEIGHFPNFDRRHVDSHFRENARNAIVTLRKLRARTTA